MPTNKVFPIQSKTACLLKWSWSTVFLGTGKTSSCHRVDQETITPETFHTFHNTPGKIRAREMMRRGEWPREGCQYCEEIERAGGTSDRMYQLKAQHHAPPPELETDVDANKVTPTILEVYFSNTCNMSCLYCGPHFSSVWEAENNRYGDFIQGPIHLNATNIKEFTPKIKQTLEKELEKYELIKHLIEDKKQSGLKDRFNNYDNKIIKLRNSLQPNYNPFTDHYDKMLLEFWSWLSDNYQHLEHLHILGGEPFYQKELDEVIDFFNRHPNPNLVLNLVSNLKVEPKKFRSTIDRLLTLKHQGKIARVQITGSLECWGPQQEYVRWGLDLREFTANMEYMLTKEITICVNGAINALSIKTAAEYFNKINHWNEIRYQYFPDPKDRISISFMTVNYPFYMKPDIFQAGFFKEDFNNILAAMPKVTETEQLNYDHMQGIAKQVEHNPEQPDMIDYLKIYLNEIDRRRGTDWTKLFPWLETYSSQSSGV